MDIRILSVRNQQDIIDYMQQISVDRAGIEIMASKAISYIIKIGDIASVAANIMKQEMLSLGGEVAVARGAITGKLKKTNCLIFGTLKQIRNLAIKLERQPYDLNKISQEIKTLLGNFIRDEFVIEAGRFKLNLGKRTLIMGIVNLTPDSFSADGLYRLGITNTKQFIFNRIERMIKDGADVIDIGGESTRPGAKSISSKEEIKRTVPIIKKIAKRIRVPISIDTYKHDVAKEALYSGASIVNDIMGLRADSSMARVVSKFKAPIVIMHIKGKPQTMQKNPQYKSLVAEIITELNKSIQKAVDFGIDREKIIIDPGIGFGKTTEHNLEIINRLSEFKSLGRPILIGLSRKSFIGNILNLPVRDRLMGTASAVSLAIKNGAHIVRVHDVKEMAQVVKISDSIINPSE